MSSIPNLSTTEFQMVLSAAPLVVVDVAAVRDGKVALVKRGTVPFSGCWHIPGGFLHFGETFPDAVSRIIKDECGLTVGHCKFLGVKSLYGRDPRGHLINLLYTSSVDGDLVARPGEEVAWFDPDKLPTPFLHYQVAQVWRAFE